MIIIVICLIALIAGSVFGIFFSGEDSGNGMTTKEDTVYKRLGRLKQKIKKLLG